MVKSTGIVRKVDELGRIVLPIELRNVLHIKEKDSIAFFTEGESIVLMKYEPSCIFCGNASNVTHFKGKLICNDCATDAKDPKNHDGFY